MSTLTSPSAAARDPDSSQYLEAFRGPIEPVVASPTYKLGLAVVAFAMVLLPILYLLLIVGVGYGMWWHFQFDGWILEGKRQGGRSEGAKLMFYLAPYLIGIGLMVFLTKPLFARQPKQLPPQPLDPDREPLLFAFVARICQAVGASPPRQIHVNCEVNASASFRDGIWSMFGNDLTLTIGLPLVAGLSSRELAGVLAHEFGHFSQGAGMRLTYVIRSINAWFARLVYERDGWDETLEAWCQTDLRISIWIYLVRGSIWCTRKVLWCFMMAGHGISCFMLRQMEFDADLYEARLAGSETFATTSRQMRLLGLAAEGAFQDLGHSWSEKRLADDLPMLMMAKVTQIPPDIVRKYLEHVNQQKTGTFDSHPSDQERIARAKAENAPGVFQLEAPASGLFQNFGGLSRTLTLRFYEEAIGPQMREQYLVCTEELVAGMQKTRDEDKLAERYFQGQMSGLRPLFLNVAQVAPPADNRAAVAALREARQAMLAKVPHVRAVLKKYVGADDQFLNGLKAATLIRASVPVAPLAPEYERVYGLKKLTIQSAEQLQEQGAAEIQQLSPELLEFEQLARTRLLSALGLLHVPEIQARIAGAADDLQEMRRLVERMSSLEAVFAPVMMLRRSLTSLSTLVEQIESQRANEVFFQKLRAHMNDARGHLQAIFERLENDRYPFEHSGEPMSIAHYAMAEVPAEDNLGGLLQAWDGLGRLMSLYFRILGRLARIAEKVETAVGLAPLPEVEPEVEQPADASHA